MPTGQCVHMTQNAEEDIARVLALTWRGIDSGLEAGDIARIWSLDQRWLQPHEADIAVSSMLENGWLKQVEGGLAPVELRRDLKPVLGWFPRPSNLMHPPPHRQETVQQENVAEEEEIEAPINDDKSFDDVHMLISEQSGLDPDEIKRRCSRKKRALGTVEDWMCLALVAREQGLDITSLASSLR